jgi:hypothetical protein
LVDDHSRYALGLRIGDSQQSAPILDWLRDCVELCGRPLLPASRLVSLSEPVNQLPA